jgi:tetratricopeptide (TPR) repeat protein
MGCLDDRLRDVRALTNVFANADAKVVKNAVAAAGMLPRVEGCADASALPARAPVPTDPVAAAKVDELRGRLAAIKAMGRAGKDRDELPLATALQSEAEALLDDRTKAEVLLELGVVQGRVGDVASAEASLRRAAWLADAVGEDPVRSDALGKLLYVLGYQQSRVDVIPSLREPATAVLERLRRSGDESHAQAMMEDLAFAALAESKFEDARDGFAQALLICDKVFGPQSVESGRTTSNLGLAFASLGNSDRALELYQKALSIQEAAVGPMHPNIVYTEGNIGVEFAERRQYADADFHFRRAIAVAEAALGPHHAQLAVALDNLGWNLTEQGRYEEALSNHQRALAIREAAFPPDSPQLLRSLQAMGWALIGLDRSSEAIAPLERAVSLPVIDPVNVADAKFALARALDGTRKDPARARALAIDAAATFEKSAVSPSDFRRLAEIREWLARDSTKRRASR